jgi:hypothetical protein
MLSGVCHLVRWTELNLCITDQIALPDFYFGAMENWGLVTYRETNLLYDPLTSSNRNRETTATIIAHELAHMVRPSFKPSTCFLFLMSMIKKTSSISNDHKETLVITMGWNSGLETW